MPQPSDESQPVDYSYPELVLTASIVALGIIGATAAAFFLLLPPA